MKLKYHELLMPEPIVLSNIGMLRTPTVRKVVKHYVEYQTYLSMLMLTPEKYYEGHEAFEQYDSLSIEEKQNIHIFNLLIQDESMVSVIENMLGFFFDDHIQFDFEHKVFLLFSGAKDKDDKPVPTGLINEGIWNDLCNLILQMNYVSQNEEDLSKVKNKKGLKRLERLMGLRKKNKAQKSEHDPNMELGNVISSVAADSKNLNISNIWDITIYQLWDLFARMRMNNFYEIHKTSVSIWGDKDKKFDSNAWFKNITIQK